MAKLTDDDKAKILADYHVGKSQNELAKKYKLSPATINKLCKGIEPKNIGKVNALASIRVEMASQSEYEVNAIHKEVDERTKHIQFFDNITLKNLSVMAKKLTADASIQEHKLAQEAIQKGRETVLGKTPDTAIQINNTSNEQTQQVIRPQLTKEEWLKAHGLGSAAGAAG